ncbi:MAG: FliG C-terminal domain-containing protein [Planctomycetota bacterium]
MSDSIPGVQKVAAFLLSLDKDKSAELLRRLDPRVVPLVAQAMTSLNPDLCSADSVDEIYGDLARTMYRRSGVRSQDDYELHDMLTQSFGQEEADRVLKDIATRRRQNQPLGFLESVQPEIVARVLNTESTAVVSLVLAHVSPSVSAAVLNTFDEERALDVVKRMTSIVPPGIETMLSIADNLHDRIRLAASMPAPPDPGDSLRTIAELLNFSAGGMDKTVLTGLEEFNEEMADQVREFMFTWADLAGVEKRAMQKILASVDTRTLAIALKGSPADVESNIMGNLSSRVKDIVLDERELAGPMPMSEVNTARSEIMVAVRALMDAGEFSAAKAGEELVE